MELLYLLFTVPPEVWTALVGLISAATVLLTAYTASKKQQKKVAEAVTTVVEDGQKENTVKLDEIHFLVNGRLTETLDRVKGLEAALAIKPTDPVPPPANGV